MDSREITPQTRTLSNPEAWEVAQVRPPRATGAPSRTHSHYDRILALLKERGASGVLSSELYDSPNLFGRSPRNRISELRKNGNLIQTVAAGPAVVRYVLLRDSDGIPPQWHSSASGHGPRQNILSNSSDWYERTTGKPRPHLEAEAGPLFAGVQP